MKKKDSILDNWKERLKSDTLMTHDEHQNAVFLIEELLKEKDKECEERLREIKCGDIFKSVKK